MALAYVDIICMFSLFLTDTKVRRLFKNLRFFAIKERESVFNFVGKIK